MKRLAIACYFILIGLIDINAFAVAQNNTKPSGDVAALLGNWSGESICTDKQRFPACHDEQVVYRITKSDKHPQMVVITMDKIVNGKPENMAVLDFKFDPEKQTLSCEFTRNRGNGLFEFHVQAETMEGSLVTLPDKLQVRHINVKKDK